eukprot:35172-Alexandrium_andersonii.AAC.1
MHQEHCLSSYAALVEEDRVPADGGPLVPADDLRERRSRGGGVAGDQVADPALEVALERRPWVGEVAEHVLLGAREVPLPRQQGRAENGLLVRALSLIHI